MNRNFSLGLLIGCIASIGLLMIVSAAGAQEPDSQLPIGLQSVADSSFTYQGQLKKDNLPVNGTCSFSFSLWDALGSGTPPTGGNQIGITQPVPGVGVVNGLFTVRLNTSNEFGLNSFTGDARWLQIAVDCGSGATTLAPRQQLTAAPYALSLRPGAVISNTGTGSKTFSVLANSWGGGSTPIYGQMDGPSGISLGTYAGVWGNSSDGSGVFGSSGNAYGVYGKTATGYAGVFGQIGNTWTGLNTGQQAGVLGVVNNASNFGVVGANADISGTGVKGSGRNGVWGYSTRNDGNGVIGEANSGPNAYGVWGKTTSGYGVVGSSISGYAGYFNGNVHVSGNLSVSGSVTKGGGSFKIDHPLDPENKYLYHSFVESPDMKNVYDGVTVLDANGEAVVVLPDYFGALNKDFRYQLTTIGGYAPVYIAEEIANNQFKIAGGKPGLKVSWQVTGIRQDAWAEANRIQVEENKPAEERGTYLHPELFGKPETSSLEYAKMEALKAPSESGR